MAIDLIKRNNCRNFVILEKSSNIGGTWNDQKYPGCCCDGMSPLASKPPFTLLTDISLEFIVQLFLRAEPKLVSRVPRPRGDLCKLAAILWELHDQD